MNDGGATAPSPSSASAPTTIIPIGPQTEGFFSSATGAGTGSSAGSGGTADIGVPLVALQEGLGYRRNSAQFRRFMSIAQHALAGAAKQTVEGPALVGADHDHFGVDAPGFVQNRLDRLALHEPCAHLEPALAQPGLERPEVVVGLPQMCGNLVLDDLAVELLPQEIRFRRADVQQQQPGPAPFGDA